MDSISGLLCCWLWCGPGCRWACRCSRWPQNYTSCSLHWCCSCSGGSRPYPCKTHPYSPYPTPRLLSSHIYCSIPNSAPIFTISYPHHCYCSISILFVPYTKCTQCLSRLLSALLLYPILSMSATTPIVLYRTHTIRITILPIPCIYILSFVLSYPAIRILSIYYHG